MILAEEEHLRVEFSEVHERYCDRTLLSLFQNEKR
jgi:hypothetical protein